MLTHTEDEALHENHESGTAVALPGLMVAAGTELHGCQEAGSLLEVPDYLEINCVL